MDYLYRLRWSDGYRCPRCQHDENWQIGEKKYKCRKCGYQTTVTAGTIFQDTHLPLTVWFRAIWHILSKEEGTDALELQKYLGLGSYRTAWTMLLKIRKAMVAAEAHPLCGTVAISSFSIYKKHSFSEPRILAAAEVQMCKDTVVSIGRIRIRVVNDDRGAEFYRFLKDVTEPNSIVVTDRSISQLVVPNRKYRSGILSRPKELAAIGVVTKYLEDKNLLGTQQLLSSREHLGYYLAECCFKYNHREITSAQEFFDELLRNAVLSTPMPYNEIVTQK